MTIPTDNVNNNSEKGSGPPPPVDIYRDTYVRYMGYANELGEAFRPNFPKMVLPICSSYFMRCFSRSLCFSFAFTWRRWDQLSAC